MDFRPEDLGLDLDLADGREDEDLDEEATGDEEEELDEEGVGEPYDEGVGAGE